MSKSVYDLAYDFLVRFYDNPVDIKDDINTAVIEDFKKLLSDGWCVDEIEEHLTKFHQHNPSRIPVINNLFSKVSKRHINLMNQDSFYYHNELRMTAPAPVVEIDENEGTYKRTVHPYFLEMKASYNIKDLYKYFLKHNSLYNNLDINESLFIGGLKWLVERYSLETVLYMISVANDIISSNDSLYIRNILEVKDYIKEATDAYNKCVTQIRSTGDDHIVQRNRVFPS